MEFNDPLYTVNGRMASAGQFLKAYQGSFPRVFPDKMEYEDYLEFAEDYADYVCSFEKSFMRRILKLKELIARMFHVLKDHKINDPNHDCGWCQLVRTRINSVAKLEQNLKNSYKNSLISKT